MPFPLTMPGANQPHPTHMTSGMGDPRLALLGLTQAGPIVAQGMEPGIGKALAEQVTAGNALIGAALPAALTARFVGPAVRLGLGAMGAAQAGQIAGEIAGNPDMEAGQKRYLETNLGLSAAQTMAAPKVPEALGTFGSQMVGDLLQSGYKGKDVDNNWSTLVPSARPVGLGRISQAGTLYDQGDLPGAMKVLQGFINSQNPKVGLTTGIEQQETGSMNTAGAIFPSQPNQFRDTLNKGELPVGFKEGLTTLPINALKVRYQAALDASRQFIADGETQKAVNIGTMAQFMREELQNRGRGAVAAEFNKPNINQGIQNESSNEGNVNGDTDLRQKGQTLVQEAGRSPEQVAAEQGQVQEAPQEQVSGAVGGTERGTSQSNVLGLRGESLSPHLGIPNVQIFAKAKALLGSDWPKAFDYYNDKYRTLVDKAVEGVPEPHDQGERLFTFANEVASGSPIGQDIIASVKKPLENSGQVNRVNVLSKIKSGVQLTDAEVQYLHQLPVTAQKDIFQDINRNAVKLLPDSVPNKLLIQNAQRAWDARQAAKQPVPSQQQGLPVETVEQRNTRMLAEAKRVQDAVTLKKLQANAPMVTQEQAMLQDLGKQRLSVLFQKLGIDTGKAKLHQLQDYEQAELVKKVRDVAETTPQVKATKMVLLDKLGKIGQPLSQRYKGKGEQGFFKLFGGADLSSLGIKPDTKVQGEQMYNRIKNKLGADNAAFDYMDKAGLKGFLASPRSVQEVEDWLGKNAPKVEVHSYSMEGRVSEAKKEYDKMTHEWYETLPVDKRSYVDTMKAYAHQYGGHEYSVKEHGLGYPDETAVTPELRKQAEKYAALKKQVDAEPTDTSPRATSHYSSVSALPTNEPMPDWTTTKSGKNVQRVDVVVPHDNNKTLVHNDGRREHLGVLWQPDNLHENLPNTLGWAMIQYKTGAKGEKIAVIAEAQSRWGQTVREQQARRKASPESYKSDGDNHPLLRDYNRLILKAAIEQARKEGATHIMVSDAETAMMTEGHDLQNNVIGNYATEEEAFRVAKQDPSFYIQKRGSEAKPIYYVKTRELAQEPGMRLNYDTILPKIAEELTGSKGEKTSLGVHKNANDLEHGGLYPTKEEALKVGESAYKEGNAWRAFVPRKDLIFKDASGNAKTDVSGTLYPLDKVQPKNFTMFGKDKLPSAVQAADKTSRKGETGAVLSLHEILKSVKEGATSFLEKDSDYPTRLLVTPSSKEPGKWQVSVFQKDPDGRNIAHGDILFDSRKAALESIPSDKFVQEKRSQAGSINPQGDEKQRFGVSAKSLAERASTGQIKEPSTGEVMEPEQIVEHGRALLKEGADPEKLLKVALNNKNSDAIAVTRAYGEKLFNYANKMADEYGIDSAAYKNAAKMDSEWAEKTKPLATEAGLSMRALQGETEADTGTYHGVARSLTEMQGKEPTPEQSKTIVKMTDEVKAADAKVQKTVEDIFKSLMEQAEQPVAVPKVKFKPKPSSQSGMVEHDLRDPAVKRVESLKVWQHVKDKYLDKGVLDFDDVVNGAAADLGKTPDEIRDILTASPKTKKMTDEMYIAMDAKRKAKQSIEFWLKDQMVPAWAKAVRMIPRVFFLDKIAGHGTVGMITHAGINAFDPTTFRGTGKYWNPASKDFNLFDSRAWGTYFPSFLKQYKLAWSTVNHEKWVQDQLRKPNFAMWKRVDLKCDPFKYPDDYQNASIKAFLGRLNVLIGNYGFDALKDFRINRANQIWNAAPASLKYNEDGTANLKYAKMVADSVNHSTGIIRQQLKAPWAELAGTTFFAPKLEASRWAWAVGDPLRALTYLEKWRNGTASPEEVQFAKSEVMQKAGIVATYASLLALNQAYLSAVGSDQKINYNNPTRGDFLAFKVAGHNVGVISAMLGIVRLFAKMVNAATEPQAMTKNGKPRTDLPSRSDRMATAAKDYATGKLSPMMGFVKDVVTQQTATHDTVPWSQDAPEYGHKKLSGAEYGLTTFLPIPFEEGIKSVWEQQGMSKEQQSVWMNILKGAAVTVPAALTGVRIAHDYTLDPKPEKPQKDFKLPPLGLGFYKY